MLVSGIHVTTVRLALAFENEKLKLALTGLHASPTVLGRTGSAKLQPK